MNEYRAGAVIYAREPSRLARFYEGVAGLAIVRTAERYIVLETAGFQLVVLRIPEDLAAEITLESPPGRRDRGAVKLVFMVNDLAAARAAAPLAGGILNGPEREWSFGEATVCDGVDPEGNVYQLRQMKTDET